MDKKTHKWGIKYGWKLYFKYLTRKSRRSASIFQQHIAKFTTSGTTTLLSEYDRGMVVLKIISAEERNKQKKRDPVQQQVYSY